MVFLVPDKPLNVQLRRKSPHEIEVTWEEPKIAVAGYRVYYNNFQTPNMEDWTKLDVGPYTIADINIPDEKSTYVVRVQAKSVDGRFGNLSDPALDNFVLKRKYKLIRLMRLKMLCLKKSEFSNFQSVKFYHQQIYVLDIGTLLDTYDIMHFKMRKYGNNLMGFFLSRSIYRPGEKFPGNHEDCHRGSFELGPPRETHCSIVPGKDHCNHFFFIHTE